VLETYAELQQIIEDYLEQEDVSGKIPTFIRLAESRFDRELSVRWMETIFEGDIDQQEVPLPVDFLELRSLYLTSHSPWLLAKPRPQHLFFSSSVSSLSGIPRLYTISSRLTTRQTGCSTWRPMSISMRHCSRRSRI